MARPVHEGTARDARSKGYVFPSRGRTLLWGSLAAAGAAVVVLIGGYAVGVRQTLSPGDVASYHARIDVKCAQCHDTGNEVASLRCERCHDPSGSDRLTHGAHVFMSTGDLRRAENAGETTCATCHTEHKGLVASLSAVDDRECGTCHMFSTLARHPEFAAVRAGATAGVGLKFNHDRHIIEVQARRGTTCQVCHEQTADRATFVPMTFERHCASCHAPEGVFADSDPVLGELVVPPTALPEPWRSRTSAQLQQRGRKQVASQLRHRDGWVIFNALRIRQSIDRDGEAAERLALRARIGYLEQFLTVRPVHQASPEELLAAEAALSKEIDDLDTRLAGTGASDSDALQAILAATQTLAAQLAGVDATLAAAAGEIKTATLAPPPAEPLPPDADAEGRFERRKAELLKVLETIAARTTDAELAGRAAALRTQIDSLTPQPAATPEATDVLLDRLADLDQTLAVVKAIPDPGVQSQVTQIEVLRAFGQQRLTAGLSATDFEARRAELLGLLDEIERRGSASIRLRVAGLRQRVISLRPGSSGDDELERSRARRQKQLARIRLEMELARSTRDYEPPPAQDAAVDQGAVERTLSQLRAQLTELERAPRMSAAQSAEDRESRRNELDALLSRCLKCHEYDPTGVRLSLVRAAEPVMPRSTFNHAPHTTQTTCETCHASARTSKLATDINVTGVESCTACHTPSQARAECETCHVYHPGSPARLLAVTR
ncbi:MAG: cytochrome c3 family protein [Acidobacteriota bacterium]